MRYIDNIDLSKRQKWSIAIVGVIVIAIGGVLLFAPNDAQVNTTNIERENVLSSENHSTTVVVFYSENCYHCENVLSFVQDEVSDNENVTMKSFEVRNNKTNQALYDQSIQATHRGVPAVQVGNQTWFGYTPELEQDIRSQIEKCNDEGCGVPDTYNRYAA